MRHSALPAVAFTDRTGSIEPELWVCMALFVGTLLLSWNMALELLQPAVVKHQLALRDGGQFRVVGHHDDGEAIAL